MNRGSGVLQPDSPACSREMAKRAGLLYHGRGRVSLVRHDPDETDVRDRYVNLRVASRYLALRPHQCKAEVAGAEAVIPGDGKMIHPDGSAQRPSGGHYPEQFCRSICCAKKHEDEIMT